MRISDLHQISIFSFTLKILRNGVSYCSFKIVVFAVTLAGSLTDQLRYERARGQTWKSRSNRFMSLKGEKNSMVVLLVEGSYYTMKECFPQIRRGGVGGNAIVIFGGYTT